VDIVTATIRNGRVELAEPVDWPDGTQVEVHAVAAPVNGQHRVGSPMTSWPSGFFDQLRQEWGDEPFDRPPQGESEAREDW
jgi:hypothetical protein